MHTRYGTLVRFVLDRKEIYVTKNLNEMWRAYDGEKNKKKTTNIDTEKKQIKNVHP